MDLRVSRNARRGLGRRLRIRPSCLSLCNTSARPIRRRWPVIPFCIGSRRAAQNINLSIRTLYRGGLWLNQHLAQTASTSGLNFLKSYGHLVALTLAADRDRFPVTPKLHMLHHLFLSLQQSSARNAWSLSMVATSVQQDETFVGIQGRASRRVGPTYTALRTLQRYLADAAEHLTPEFRVA